MVIVDTALKKREQEGNPVKVAIVGAGYMGRGMALQIITAIRGMEVVAISNRTLSQASKAYEQAGVEDIEAVETVAQLESAISRGKCAITDDAMLLCEADGIDAVVEATGEVEFGAHVTLKAIEHKKHVILMNAELDAVVGPHARVMRPIRQKRLLAFRQQQRGVFRSVARTDPLGRSAFHRASPKPVLHDRSRRSRYDCRLHRVIPAPVSRHYPILPR